MSISIRETKCQIDIGLFLDKYPLWGLGTPHCSVILHEMFLHATDRGWKEAECMVHWGCQGSIMGPDPQAGPSTMELVWYHTSRKEIQDIYQSVLLLWRLPGLPCCGNEQRKRWSRISISLWKIESIGMDAQPLPPRAWSKKRSSGLDWVDGNHMRKLLGWPAKGC